MVFDFTVGKVHSLLAAKGTKWNFKCPGGHGIFANSSTLESDIDYSHR